MIWLPSTSSADTIPEEVAHSELLARSVHHKNGFKRGKSKGEQDKVTLRAFDPPKNPVNRSKRLREISVDRCQYLTESQAVALAWERAPARGGDFFGWATITAEDARKCGTEVVSSPAKEQNNPAHADILLPAGDIDDEQARNGRLAGTGSSFQLAGYSRLVVADSSCLQSNFLTLGGHRPPLKQIPRS